VTWPRAIALNRLLHRLMPHEPEVIGLLALLLLHESRAAARFDGWGRLLRLQDQDRALWNRDLAEEAAVLLSRAMVTRRPGPYQIQAAIAAVHMDGPTYDQTDWRQVRLLYDRLQVLTPSPIVLLNRAVATRFAIGPAQALAEVEVLAADLDHYRLYHAVRAERLRWPAIRPSASCSLAASRCNATSLLRDDRPDLHGDPAPVNSGPALGDVHGLLDGLGLQERIAAEYLFGLHVGPVGDAARAHGLGRGRPVELVAGVRESSGPALLVIPSPDLGHPGLKVGSAQPLTGLRDHA
jgi:hypothetical protein